MPIQEVLCPLCNIARTVWCGAGWVSCFNDNLSSSHFPVYSVGRGAAARFKCLDTSINSLFRHSVTALKPFFSVCLRCATIVFHSVKLYTVHNTVCVNWSKFRHQSALKQWAHRQLVCVWKAFDPAGYRGGGDGIRHWKDVWCGNLISLSQYGAVLLVA